MFLNQAGVGKAEVSILVYYDVLYRLLEHTASPD
jgi:hypothetical protein